MKTLIAGRKLDALLKTASQVVAANVPGAFAECGVYQGGSLHGLANVAPDREVYGFDTFEGLPAEAWREDEPHHAGEFGDTSLEAVARRMPANVQLVPGLFPASAHELSAERFALVHLDFDFYESTRAALEWLLPRMSPGGVIVFDDYRWQNCPGVERAIEEAGLAVVETAPCQATYWVAT